MKILLWIFFITLSSSAMADYEIEGGSVVYTAMIDVEYFLEIGSEQGNSLVAGETIEFNFGQRAIFRGEGFKESFVPVFEIQNIGSIIDVKIPVGLLASATLYQYYSSNVSVCRVLFNVSADHHEFKRFISKSKDMRLDIKERKNHISFDC